MRIISTFTFAAAMLFGATAVAQEQTVASFYTYNQPNVMYGVSPNGKYAVGCDEGVLTGAAVYWSHETGKFTDVFGVNADGVMTEGKQATLYGVANDGTAVGNFVNEAIQEEGKAAPVVPGVYKDGKWTALELLIDPLPGDANGWARKISADGRIIIGTVTMEEKTEEFQGSTLVAAGRKVPVMWIDGKIRRIDDWDYQGQGAYIRDMSDDGSVLVGWTEWYDGSRAPSVFKDGKVIRLCGTTPARDDVDKWDGWVYEGQLFTVSGDGTRCGGYFDRTAQGGIKGLVWDIPAEITDTLVEESEVTSTGSYSPTAMDAEGRVYTTGAMGGGTNVWVDGENTPFVDYYNVVSNDDTYVSPAGIYDVDTAMKTFATTTIESAGGMGSYNAPLVIVFEDTKVGNGVTSVETDGLSLSYAGNRFTVTGEHRGIEVYTTNGTQVMQAGPATNDLDLSTLGGGIYLVKVSVDGGFKVMKVLVD